MKRNLRKILSLVLALSMLACFTACGEEEAPAPETTEAATEAPVQPVDEEAALRELTLPIVKEVYSGNAGAIRDLFHPAQGLLDQSYLDMINETVTQQLSKLGVAPETAVSTLDVTGIIDVSADAMADFSARYDVKPTDGKLVAFGITTDEGVVDTFNLCLVQLSGQWYITDCFFAS